MRIFVIDYVDTYLMLKLGLSACLGLIIGLERELKRKPLGLKTSLVISIISCLLTIVSIEAAYYFPGNEEIRIQMDPLRLAAQIVSGIGFLGAGVILRRENESISGLTTAAMIWGAAGIGIAVGAGFFIEAIVGVVLILISVEMIPFFFSKIGPQRLFKKDIRIKILVSESVNIDEILARLKSKKISTTYVRMKIDKKSSTCLFDLKVRIHEKATITDIYNIIDEMGNIATVEIID